MKPPGPEPSSPASLRRVYFTGIALSAALFAFHTWVIFETALLLTLTSAEAIRLVGVHVAGPLLILGSFFILFITHLLEAAVWARTEHHAALAHRGTTLSHHRHTIRINHC